MGTGKVILVTAVTSILVSAATFFALRALTGSAGAENVVVPSLSGLRPNQARRLLEAKGLLLIVSEQRDDPVVAEGLIASQTPLEGSQVKKGSEVRVVVSKGSGQVQVPAVARLPLTGAIQVLTAAGFKLGPVTRQPSDQVPKDSVISATPQEGQPAAKGSPISLLVSDGAGPVKIPSVLLKDLASARRILEEAGFKVGRVNYTYDEDRREGVVLRQTPAADGLAPKGSEIQLLVNEAD